MYLFDIVAVSLMRCVKGYIGAECRATSEKALRLRTDSKFDNQSSS